MTFTEKRKLDLGSRDWHDQIAQLFLAVDTGGFPDVLVQALSHVVSFDFAASFCYRGSEPPICTFEPRQRHRLVDSSDQHRLVTEYLEGAYLLDPFFQVCEDGIEPGLYRLRDIAPDRFYHSEYYRSYYRRTNLIDEVGFVVSLPDDMMLVISILRANTSVPFRKQELNRLQEVEPVIRTVAIRYWRAHRSSESLDENGLMAPPSFDDQVARAFENFGAGTLTPREREIVRLLLRGHSSESVGFRLEITTGTVRVHRRNIYEKLSISSQTELFGRFISSLSTQ